MDRDDGIRLSARNCLGAAQETKGSEKAEAAEAAKNAPALAAAVKDATVSLEAGLRASEAEGKPISGKFEIEDGKLQLSVYTAKDGQFFEVIVDHKTGKVTKVEPSRRRTILKTPRSKPARWPKQSPRLPTRSPKP